MRLMYISASLFPGPQAHTVNVVKMCSAFAEAGCDVTLVHRRGATPVGAADLGRHYHATHRFRSVTAHLPAAAARLFALVCVRALIARRPALVYTRDPRFALLMARAGRRVALEVHHSLDGFGARSLVAFRRLARHRRLVKVVAISQAIVEDLVRLVPVLEGRLMVAHDGADPFPADIPAPALPAAGADRITVGYVGHLYPGKGMEIIAALAPLCPWADFEVVGGMPEELARWRIATAGQPNIRLHGPIPHANVPRRLRGFDVVLAPYLRHVMVSEGRVDVARWMSPLKIFEYMAAGLPIVTSDLPVIHEVLSDGETAILCPPERIESWVAALALLHGDAALRARLGTAARRTFLARYTWARRAEAILAGIAGERRA